MSFLTSKFWRLTFGLLALAAPPAHAAVLPNIMTDVHVARNTARWTIRDIVEVRRVKATAIQGSSLFSAFIVVEPSIADGKNHYGLYEMDVARREPPRKIAESDFMADLAWRPNTKDWTVRANFGVGVQLYTVKRSGLRQPLFVNNDTELVGGSDGIVPDASEGPHLTGIVSYGWSHDGRRFWYSRLRHRDKSSRNALLDAGIVFNDDMGGLSVRSVNDTTTIADWELRVFDTTDGHDNLVATTSARAHYSVFGGSNYGGVDWVDSSHLQYRQLKLNTWSLWRYDLATGKANELQGSRYEIFSSTPTEAGYMTVRNQGSTSDLVEVSATGQVVKRYGEVSGKYMIGSIWRSADADRFIYDSYFANRSGLIAFPEGRLSKALQAIPDHLSACSFNSNLSFGLCSDESLSKAPELVSISGTTGDVAVVARPNARYDAISPLKTVAKNWINRYGAKNNGYLIYPRGYIAGQSYPLLVVTHGSDAKNYFVSNGFQWEFPIQVMAEQGYFVLEINEPAHDPSVPHPILPGGAEAGVEKQQLNLFLNPTASIEAAVEPLISSGLVNPNRVGIAGYSHGAETAYFAISHSTLFSAVSLGDDQGLVPSWFWVGTSITRPWLKGLYGGSPYDPAALDNYRKYSTSFRLKKVQAPLLQQYASIRGGEIGLEVDQLFKDAGIPTELVVYPGESHIFYEPRHCASAMVRNLDWFNYWLLDRRDPNPAKAVQYTRWDAMATRWRHSQQVAGSGAVANVGSN